MTALSGMDSGKSKMPLTSVSGMRLLTFALFNTGN
jgi:hypothetical protein